MEVHAENDKIFWEDRIIKFPERWMNIVNQKLFN